MFMVSSSDTFYVILLDIQDIYVYFFIISPLSFHAENNLDQWYQSRFALDRFSVHVPDEVRV
jgi:hypothetical protein